MKSHKRAEDNGAVFAVIKAFQILVIGSHAIDHVGHYITAEIRTGKRMFSRAPLELSIRSGCAILTCYRIVRWRRHQVPPPDAVSRRI